MGVHVHVCIPLLLFQLVVIVVVLDVVIAIVTAVCSGIGQRRSAPINQGRRERTRRRNSCGEVGYYQAALIYLEWTTQEIFSTPSAGRVAEAIYGIYPFSITMK